MSDLALSDKHISSMSAAAIEKVCQLEEMMLKFPQTKIATEHLIHAGMYARTIMVPEGIMLTGALMKIATILIISGNFILFSGDEAKELTGYNVLAGGPNRKQAGIAKSDTWVTMIFPTQAKTVEEAEIEFTDVSDQLASRGEDAKNFIQITET